MRRFLSRHSPFPILCIASVLLIGLTACSSGGLGDILGGGSAPPPSTSPDITEVRGTVEYVDPDAAFIELERVATRSNLQNGGAETFRLYVYDDTQVTYDGDIYRPRDLERGDEVIARAEEDNGRWYASEDIRVSYDSSPDQTADNDGGTWDDDPWDNDPQPNDTPQTGDADADFRGTVVAINTQDRTIELDRDTYYSSRFSTGGHQNDVVVLHYDARTRVLYDGNYYKPENLERGDEILVDAELISNRWVAEDIEVVENVRNPRGR